LWLGATYFIRREIMKLNSGKVPAMKKNSQNQPLNRKQKKRKNLTNETNKWIIGASKNPTDIFEEDIFGISLTVNVRSKSAVSNHIQRQALE
jgi:hypothetical protein